MDNQKLIESDLHTAVHINHVRGYLADFMIEINKRSQIHDASKFESPEREIFAEHAPELAKTVYGSKDYLKLLEKVKIATEHHYSKNRHHPEFHKNGVNDMNLVDLIEMICDWKAATKRNKNGNIRKSLEINSKRYGMNEQLIKILENTVKEVFED